MFWRANIKFMKEILVRMENSFYSHHMTMCWHGGCCDLGLYFLTEYQCQRRILLIRSLTPEIPWKEQNKLCYSLCLNELCKCMWQVNIGGLWRRYPQPPDSAEPRRPGPNEDWTLIIRRIWLPHETSAHTHTHAHTRGHIHTRLHTNAHIHTNTPIHTHRACLITPLFSLWATHRHTHTHTHRFPHLTRFSLSPGPLQVVHSVLVSSALGFFCIADCRCRRSRGSGSYGNTAD